MSVVSGAFFLLCAVLLMVYYRVPAPYRWTVLLAGSWIFYGAQSMNAWLYMLFTTVSTYLAGRILGCFQARFDKRTASTRGKPWLWLCLLSNFGLLFVCKLRILGGGLLPLGISFYLFQSMGYLLDVYRGRQIPVRCLGRFALFVSFFPQLIQGPISRASSLLPQLTEPRPYSEQQLSYGLQRMLWGYFKKLVIAERIAPAVVILRESGGLFWLSLAYALQIYGDFTGGIDIALGLSEAFGISLTENFKLPFFAKNTAEFWRRWHISLGEWMKDYVFYPISVSKPMLTFGRFTRKHLGQLGKRLPVYAASGVTWLITGIWHGLTPNFLLWGMLNWAAIVLSQEMTPLYAAFHGRFHLKEKPAYGVFEMLRTFLLMNLIRTVDLFPRVGMWVQRLLHPIALPHEALLQGIDCWILAGGTILMLAVSLAQKKHGSVRDVLRRQPRLLRQVLLLGLFLLVLMMGCYGIGYNPSSFIYSAF